MMKKKNIVGILALVSGLCLGFIGFFLLGQGIDFSATLIHLAMLNLVVLVALSGVYLINNHCETKDSSKKIIWGIAAAFMIFGALVSFNIIDFSSAWNYLIGVGLIFTTLVQMQILDWEVSKGILKILGLLTLLGNLFLIAFFLFKLTPESMGQIFDIAVIISAFSFLVGLIFYVPKKPKAA
ncbi:MAG: hypothetical protein ACI857_000364 [Arenicella sp.]|jgi:hypothetical protein